MYEPFFGNFSVYGANAGALSPLLRYVLPSAVPPPCGNACSGGIAMLGCPLNQNGDPWLSLKPEYGFAGSGPSSGGRLSPLARNVTVCTTRLLKTHFTESPAWIVTVLRKNPFMSSSAGNFNPPA